MERNRRGYAGPELGDDGDKGRSRLLYSYLAAMVNGRLLRVIRGVTRKNGREAWRQLVELMEPATRSRALAILQGLLTTKFEASEDKLYDEIVQWEQRIEDYTRSGGQAFTDELKVAILLASLRQDIKVHLLMRIKDSTKYSEARGVLVDYLRAQKSWTPSTGPAPMEVDALNLRAAFSGTCNNCGKVGHNAENCWSKGKGKGNNSEQGGKGKNKGKGKRQGR